VRHVTARGAGVPLKRATGHGSRAQ
jgi:hypothetical protein